MPPGRARAAVDPVIAAGVGVRLGYGWAFRAASFRVGATPGRSALGVHFSHPSQATALVDLLAGLARPAYGELRVLGHDMATIRGRAAVRRQAGVARRTARQLPGMKIRSLVAHAARLGVRGQGGPDRHVLAAAVLDRMGLTPWAEVTLRAAPDVVARRARLAAAAAHQPDLILLDGLLDDLELKDVTALAATVRELGIDCGVVLAGCDGGALALASDEVLVLADGVLSPA